MILDDSYSIARLTFCMAQRRKFRSRLQESIAHSQPRSAAYAATFLSLFTTEARVRLAYLRGATVREMLDIAVD